MARIVWVPHKPSLPLAKPLEGYVTWMVKKKLRYRSYLQLALIFAKLDVDSLGNT